MNLFPRNRKGASSEAPDPITPLAPKPLSKTVVFGKFALLIALFSAGAWGVLHHPAYQDYTLSRLELSKFQPLIATHMDDPIFLYQLGRKLNEKERFVEADPFLQRAVGISPENPKYRDEWARALLGKGVTSAAYGQLREFVGKHDSMPEAHLILGKFYVTQKSMQHAKEELDRTVQLNPQSGEAYALLSIAESSLGNEQKARDASKRAVELRPDNANDHLNYSQFLLRANDPIQAKKLLVRAIELAPNQADIRKAYAEWLLTYGKQPDFLIAQSQAKKAVELNPRDGSSQLVLGRSYSQLSQFQQALAPLQEAVKSLPDDSSPALELSHTYRTLNMTKEAEEWRKIYLARLKYEQERSTLWEALRVNPQDVVLHKKLARLYGLHGDIEGCVRQYATAFHCANDSPPALIAAATDLCEGGFASKALPLAQQATDVASSSPKAHLALGDALLGIGQVHQAGLQYDKVVGWSPELREPLKKKLQAYVQDQANHPSPAEQAYRSAKRLAQETVGPRQMTPAVEALAKSAVDLDSQNPKYVWFLMEVQIAQKEKDAAIASARKLLVLAPGDSRGNALLGVLLAEKANSPAEFQEADRYLIQSSKDPLVKATYHYGKGVLALRQNKGKLALKELTLSTQLDPKSDVGFYQLAQAQKLAGDTQAAEKTMSLYLSKQETKKQLAEVLGNISQNPNDRKSYDKAANLYDRSGLPEQASAIRKAAKDRRLF